MLLHRPKGSSINEKPGVYKMKDRAGNVMYVGKSKSLRIGDDGRAKPLSVVDERTIDNCPAPWNRRNLKGMECLGFGENIF
ncbi:MAG: hypothetical protein WC187_04030 [Bacillota bacterium]